MITAMLMAGLASAVHRPPDAQFTGRTTQTRCGLIMLAHVPKTGGSTISEVLQALPSWIFLGRPNSGHPRFFAMHAAVFGYGKHVLPSDCRSFANDTSALERSGCHGGWMLDWRSTRVVVDFHEPR
jgi:hypothetical protein